MSSGGNESETGLLYVWCLLGKEKSEFPASQGNADKVSSLLDVMPVDWLAKISKDSSISIFMVVQEDYTWNILMVVAESSLKISAKSYQLKRRHVSVEFYILLTVHHTMILGNEQRDAQFFSTFLFLFLPLYIFSSTSCSSSGETFCQYNLW